MLAEIEDFGHCTVFRPLDRAAEKWVNENVRGTCPDEHEQKGVHYWAGDVVVTHFLKDVVYWFQRAGGTIQ